MVSMIDDRAAEPAVDMIRDDTFENGSLEDSIEPALIGVEVITGHWIGLRVGLGWLIGSGLRRVRLCSATAGIRRAGMFPASP